LSIHFEKKTIRIIRFPAADVEVATTSRHWTMFYRRRLLTTSECNIISMSLRRRKFIWLRRRRCYIPMLLWCR